MTTRLSAPGPATMGVPGAPLLRPGPPVLLAGGEVLLSKGPQLLDLLVVDARIAAIGAGLEVPAGTVVLDAEGAVVGPGLVDLHTHLREPGATEAETVESGARAAALGGYSAVVAMPNTEPPIDSVAVARHVLELGRAAAVEVAVAGAITVGRQGVALAPLGALAELGIRLFTDDGRGVQDARLLRRALEYGSMFNIVLAEHCEDEVLAAGGQMHEGRWSSALGIPGQPSIAEEVMLERDLALVRVTGAPMHFLHLSTARSVELVRRARAEGLPVTAEATPHHLALTDAEVASFDPVFKVNPPLRGEADVAALRQGVVDGVIEAIATDHAPHPAGAKDVPFDLAAPGMLGLETALSIALETIGEAIGLAGVFDRCSTGPARVAGLSSRGHGGPLFIGRPAHLCVLDPSARRRFEPARSASRSRNSPFARRELVGAVRHTLVGGEIVVRDGEAQR